MVLVGTASEVRTMLLVAHNLGVPEKSVLSNCDSKTTLDNAYFARLISGRFGFERLFLVVSDFQASRTFRTFTAVFGRAFPIRLVLVETGAGERMLKRERFLSGLGAQRLIGIVEGRNFGKKFQDLLIRLLERMKFDQYFMAHQQGRYGDSA